MDSDDRYGRTISWVHYDENKTELSKTPKQTRYEQKKEDLSERKLLLETEYSSWINSKVNERKFSKIAIIEGALVQYLFVSNIGGIFFVADI